MLLHNKQSGFTLIEMIIVVAILSICAGIAIPTYLDWLPKSRLNGAARQVMGDLMLARMQAVTQNNEFRVFFFDNKHEYQILDDDNDDGNIDIDEWTQTKDIQSEYSDVTISFEDDLIMNPIFSPKGTASNQKTIKLTNSSGSKYIKIALTGRVKIDDTQ